jgi:hypothetical protein
VSHAFGSQFPSPLHASPRPQPPAAADRLIAVGAGGAFLGASLAGVVGAIVGGLFGLAVAHAANRSEAQRS